MPEGWAGRRTGSGNRAAVRLMDVEIGRHDWSAFECGARSRPHIWPMTCSCWSRRSEGTEGRA